MLRKLLIALFLVAMLSSPAGAGEGTATIYGAVHDNYAPLVDTEITIIGEATYTSRSTTTNEHGVYFINKLPADEYIIHAIPQPTGVYVDGTANVILRKGHAKEVNFPMKKK